MVQVNLHQGTEHTRASQTSSHSSVHVVEYSSAAPSAAAAALSAVATTTPDAAVSAAAAGAYFYSYLLEEIRLFFCICPPDKEIVQVNLHQGTKHTRASQTSSQCSVHLFEYPFAAPSAAAAATTISDAAASAAPLAAAVAAAYFYSYLLEEKTVQVNLHQGTKHTRASQTSSHCSVHIVEYLSAACPAAAAALSAVATTISNGAALAALLTAAAAAAYFYSYLLVEVSLVFPAFVHLTKKQYKRSQTCFFCIRPPDKETVQVNLHQGTKHTTASQTSSHCLVHIVEYPSAAPSATAAALSAAATTTSDAAATAAYFYSYLLEEVIIVFSAFVHLTKKQYK
ncbi:uncharacterized protein [Palaemon carinicauda]|uniref:uncharacterized protein n=1 Tax=Palaemon carinicauda TaxID=392227 RepID=UPI0035B5C86C